MNTVEKPWAVAVDRLAERLNTSLDNGLSEGEAVKRRERFGPNRVERARRRSAFDIFIDQWKNLIVLLLGAAALLALAAGHWLESASVAVALFLNIGIGFFTELKAVRSLESLDQITRVPAKVKRGGSVQRISADDLVPGDVVLFAGGEVVPADVRLGEAAGLEADESPLTGESVPAAKQTDPVAEDAPLAERASMLFKGSSVTSGSGYGVAAATGKDTQIGRIAELVEQTGDEKTPLEKRLNRLGHRLIYVTIVVAALVAAGGAWAGRDVFVIVETAIALAVAAIPEGLPIVATIALAKGVWRMARRNALINRLSAVETLGGTTIICTDKTGTLTENRMRVARLELPGRDGKIRAIYSAGGGGLETAEGEAVDIEDDVQIREAVETGVLCNNAHLGGRSEDDGGVGDPMEVALLEFGRRQGIDREELLQKEPEEREDPFDRENMMMATIHRSRDGRRAAVKGAPAAVLEKCRRIKAGEEERDFSPQDKELWTERVGALAEDGFRVLALAAARVEDPEDDPYADLVFLGLTGMLDPPRPGVDEALEDCREAGVRVVMVTGDHPATALDIARKVGLVGDGEEAVEGKRLDGLGELSDEEKDRLAAAQVFARVTPEQKLNLIDLHRRSGGVVAMTGDGINDTPALKKADIGIAMGRRGTQSAREAADMVLQDDAFQSIAAAIEEGRSIFQNIRKFMVFLLSGNAGEIMIIVLAMTAGLPLPLLPLQILYLNIIGDVFPALALGVGPGERAAMQKPPRDPQEPILTRSHWLALLGYGLVLSVSVLVVFALALERYHYPQEEAVTVSFLTLSFARLWHVFNMRDSSSGLFINEITRNAFVWVALAVCVCLLLLAAYAPGLSFVLKLTGPDPLQWGLIIGFSLIPLLLGQVIKTAVRLKE